MPLVSVVIPVYNHEKYVAECIDSALGQTYRDFEVVVVDDGSTDRTPEILDRYAGRITRIRQENRGGAAALNTAILHARGEFIAWVSSDDVYMPTMLEEQVRFFAAHPEIGLAYTDFYLIDGQGVILHEERSPFYCDRRAFLQNLLACNFINGSSVMFRRKCIDAAGGFDETMRYHADGNLWFRMLRHCAFGHIALPLLKYRWHDTNLSHHTRGMRAYLKLHYRKIFAMYAPEELVSYADRSGTANFLLAGMLIRQQGLYGLGLEKIMEGLRRGLDMQGLKALCACLRDIPLRVADDLCRVIAS